MIRLFLNLAARRRSNPARELALIGVAKRRASVKATARLMRQELGLPADPRLAHDR